MEDRNHRSFLRRSRKFTLEAIVASHLWEEPSDAADDRRCCWRKMNALRIRVRITARKLKVVSNASWQRNDHPCCPPELSAGNRMRHKQTSTCSRHERLA